MPAQNLCRTLREAEEFPGKRQSSYSLFARPTATTPVLNQCGRCVKLWLISNEGGLLTPLRTSELSGVGDVDAMVESSRSERAITNSFISGRLGLSIKWDCSL